MGSRIVRGEPSEEVSFTAGRASAGHLFSEVNYGQQPLNGSFETHLDASGMPDHWVIASGTLGSNVTVEIGSGAYSGDRFIRFSNASVAREIRSAIFPAEASAAYVIQYSINVTAAGLLPEIGLRWLDEDQAFISDSGNFDGSSGAWVRKFARFTSTSGTRFAQMYVKTAAIASVGFDIDALSTRLSVPWEQEPTIAVPSFSNSWVNFGGGTPAAGYWKDSLGIVHLHGCIKDGTIGATAFTLSTGYRPASGLSFPAVGGGSAFGILNVNSSGTVVPAAGSNAAFWLEGITFRAA